MADTVRSPTMHTADKTFRKNQATPFSSSYFHLSIALHNGRTWAECRKPGKLSEQA